jgi:GNAT superfamily N-acetyltransferase
MCHAIHPTFIKRMYMPPRARGPGIGRAILERLLAHARTIDYQVVRLETLNFMREAYKVRRRRW